MQEPYSLKQKGGWIWCDWEVWFKDESYVATMGSYRQAKSLVGMLNGAYNVGRTDQLMNTDATIRLTSEFNIDLAQFLEEVLSVNSSMSEKIVQSVRQFLRSNKIVV